MNGIQEKGKMKKFTLVLAIAMLVMSVSAVWATAPTYTENWDGRGTDSEKCGLVGQEGRPPTGWIHWVFSTKGDSTNAELVLGGTGSGTYSPGEPLNAEVWHFYTPYFDLDGLTATINLFGGAPGIGGGLVISDFCPGVFVPRGEVKVTKTANTTYTREYLWDIDKKVETYFGYMKNDLPKIWLYTNGSGDETATWTVDVIYKGYMDKAFAVSGNIKVENQGNIPAKVYSVSDYIETSADINVVPTCPALPVTLQPGEYLECTYSSNLPDKSPGMNFATASGNFLYPGDTVWGSFNVTGTAAITFGDPTTEINKTVNVKDISDLFGEVHLGTVTAPIGGTFTYDKDFAYDDFEGECGHFEYDNTATVVETGKSASATLLVNVQCLIFQGETAWAANGNKPLEFRYTSQGNWATYVQYANKTTTLFAGQTIPVGTVHFSSVVSKKVTITVTLTGNWEFEDVAENLKVQGYAKAPSGNPSPGLFAHKKTCDTVLNACSIVVPANNFYGVHVNVGQWVPDPKFGP
jgi:hypothetical protein